MAHEITTLAGNYLQGNDSINCMSVGLLIWSHPYLLFMSLSDLLPLSVCGTLLLTNSVQQRGWKYA